jgi:hypothetical protein
LPLFLFHVLQFAVLFAIVASQQLLNTDVVLAKKQPAQAGAAFALAGSALLVLLFGA